MYENVPIETFSISFESTQNKQQYGTKITSTEVRKKAMVITNVLKLLSFLTDKSQCLGYPPPISSHWILLHFSFTAKIYYTERTKQTKRLETGAKMILFKQLCYVGL